MDYGSYCLHVHACGNCIPCPNTTPYTTLERRRSRCGRHDLLLANDTTSALLREVCEETWKAAGHASVTQGEDVTVTALNHRLELSTPTNLLTWDAVGELELELLFEAGNPTSLPALRRTYSASSKRKTVLGPEREDCEAALEACLESLALQLANDRELIGWLKRLGPRGASPP